MLASRRYLKYLCSLALIGGEHEGDVESLLLTVPTGHRRDNDKTQKEDAHMARPRRIGPGHRFYLNEHGARARSLHQLAN